MAKNQSPEGLSERNQQLLKTLISQYIREGLPVGSKALAADLSLSSATIRHVMSDLEKMGFLHSPHTSAGRIPTTEGYRLFIDRLLTVQPLEEANVEGLRQSLESEASTSNMVAQASEFLSGMTSLAGIVTIPTQAVGLKQVEFLPLSENRVLAIIVTSDLEVQNRIIHVNRAYGAEELQIMAAKLNEQFAGQEMSAICDVLIRDMKATREYMDKMMRSTVDMAEQVFSEAPKKGDYIVAGQTNLMGVQDLGNINKLKELFDTFNQKNDMLHLMDRAMKGQGVQIYIGSESGYDVFSDCSVVASTYEVDNKPAGVLAVIGPTRMAYDQIIPAVDITARILGSALNSRK